MAVICCPLFCACKVHIFWEGHKILRNLRQLFVLCTATQSNNWWRFRKILGPSQNIWTLFSISSHLPKRNEINACQLFSLHNRSWRTVGNIIKSSDSFAHLEFRKSGLDQHEVSFYSMAHTDKNAWKICYNEKETE